MLGFNFVVGWDDRCIGLPETVLTAVIREDQELLGAFIRRTDNTLHHLLELTALIHDAHSIVWLHSILSDAARRFCKM